MVYGLGFGLLLVLLVVPAMMAMQQDVNRQVAAFRRGLQMRRGGTVRAGLIIGFLAMLAWLAATMGVTMATGALPVLLLDMMPMLAGGPALFTALLVFISGVLLLVAVLYLVLALARGVAVKSIST